MKFKPFFLLFIIIFFLITIVPRVEASFGTTEIRIARSDAEALRRLNPDAYQVGSYIGAGCYNTAPNWQYGGGMIFQNIQIPNSAIISECWISFICRSTYSGTTVKTSFSFEANDTTVVFASKSDFDSRYASSIGSTNWDSIGTHTAGVMYNGTSLVSGIQLIFNRVGWVSGNNITVFWDDFADRSTHDTNVYREEHAWDATNTTRRALLHIKWAYSFYISVYSNDGGVFEINGAVITNASVLEETKYSILNFSALPNGNQTYLFNNFTILGGASNSSNPSQLNITSTCSIWCYFVNSSGGVPFIYSIFSMNNTAPYQNIDTVFFNGTDSNASSPITSYLWDFGDNGTGSGVTETHIYSVDGVFTVNLTVVSGAMSNTFLQNITVQATSINVTFDWFDLLFGSGAWIPLIIIIAVFFILVTWNRYAVVAALPVMAIFSLMYFDYNTVAIPLIWHALIMITSAIILLLYSAIKK